MHPQIQYLKSFDGTILACTTMGSGPPLVLMPVLPTGHLEMEWQLPGRAAWYEHLAESFTLIRYDGRGTGLSQREVDDLSFEAQVSDLQLVTEKLAAAPFSVLARNFAGPVALTYAARHPERVGKLALWHTFSRVRDYLEGRRARALRSLMDGGDWELYTETLAYANQGWPETAAARQFANYIRGSVSQSNYVRTWDEFAHIDCTDNLSEVTCPTLVFHRRDTPKFDLGVSMSLASAIPNARLVLVEGVSWALFGEDLERVTETLAGFLKRGFAEDEAPDSHTLEPLNFRLTGREAQILRLLCTGRPSKDIARETQLSVHTVERHIANIYNKLGAHNRVEATAFALRHGLA